MLKTYMPILLIAVLCISCHGGHPVTFENPRHAWKVMKTTKNHVCRRSAYIYLSAQEGEREEAWRWAILSADPVIRRDAVSSLFRLKGDEGARLMLEMAPEKDMLVIEALKTVIRHVESPELRRQLSAKVVIPTAAAKVGEDGVPFRQNIRLQDDPTYDHEIATVDKISLAQEKWRIQTDPDNKGIEKKLFAMDLQDGDWKPIAVDRNWEPQGLTDYDGHAWYRVT